MKDRRLKRFWYRAGPLAAAGALLTGGAWMGCSSDSPTSSSTSGTGASSDVTSSTTTMSGGTGGASTTGGAGGASTTAATTSSSGTGGMHDLAIGSAADAHRPFDATPSPDGAQVYFTAAGANGLGVYKVPSDGSAPTPVAVYPTAIDPANPFAAPVGIAVSTDGKTIFVADPGAGTTDRGAMYAIPAGGGAPALLSGTDGLAPRSIDVVAVGGLDTLYFSGTNANGKPGIFSVPAAGGTVTPVSVGAPLQDPSGLTVAKDGAIYLVDTIASGSNTAQILVIPQGGTPKLLIDTLRVGYPAGIAISADDKTLYVSGLNTLELTDRFLVVDIATAKVAESFKAELGTFTESGGLHRAKKSDVFALVDSSAGPMGGKVFVIK